ncbi:acyltransferase family protein [Micromonospora sp. NPDC047620]|uniref:acyltransferase family protein n=1 Tax=Micromonospora sp. NPDC047620 TaxID=3364251 RepID=UPI003710E7B7
MTLHADHAVGPENLPARMPAGPEFPPTTVTSPAPAQDRKQRTGDRLYVLDLLRFSAALAVLGFHMFIDNDNRGYWGTGVEGVFGGTLVAVFRYGWVGVEFFFVISGFVICMSCWGRSVTDFAVSRVTRLMPAYVFAVLVTSAALALWPLETGRPQPSHVLINATMLQTFVGIPNIDSVYWTLFVELKFYLLFAIVVRFGLTYRRVVLFCVLWMVAALYAQYSEFQLLVSIAEPRFAPYFIAGIALYLIHRFGPNLLLSGILGTAVILGVVELSRRVAEQNANRPKPVVSFEVALPAMLIFFAVMVAVALGWFSGVKWRGLTVIGALTYPVYLLHMQFSRIAVGRLYDSVSPWALVAGLVTGVLLLAYLTHRFVEKPVARVLRRKLQDSFAQIRNGSHDDENRDGRRMANLDRRGAPVPSPRADAESVALRSDQW